jgi:hypothetical protein
MSRHWTIGGPPSSDENIDDEAQPEVRPWQPGVASPPVVRTPQFMLGGRLAAVREPQFMRRILPRFIDPALEQGESVSRSEVKNHGK